MSRKKRLDVNAIDVDSLEVEELEQVAGGETDQNNNCHSCTCPAQPNQGFQLAGAVR